MNNADNNSVPNSSKVMDLLKAMVDTSTAIMKTVVKNQPTYVLSLIAMPLYFKVMGKLYAGYAKFSINNIVNAGLILTAGKMMAKTIPVIDSGIESIHSIINKLDTAKSYRKAGKKVKGIYELLGITVGGLAETNGKMKGFSLSDKSLGKNLGQMIFNMILYNRVLKYWSKSFEPLFTSVIPVLGSYSKREHKKVKKGLIRIQELLGALVDFLSSDLIKKQNSISNIKNMAKLTTLCGQVVVLGGTIASLGYLAAPIMMGSLAFRTLIWGILGIFQTGKGEDKKFSASKADNINKSTSALTILIKGLAVLLTAIVAERIIKHLVSITEELKDVKAVVIGAAALTAIMVSLVGLLKLMSWVQNKFKLNSTDNLQALMTIITSFITAWAAAKISETIAPIGKQAGDILLGIAVISGLTFAFIGIFSLVSRVHVNNVILSVVNVITSFITAWAAAKIAETIAPIGKIAGWVLLGTLVICTVVLMLIGTFRLAQSIVNAGKLLLIAIGFVVLSVAVLVTFTNLALAMIFAPGAVITMAALLLVCSFAALVGLMWKQVVKGALAMAALSIALAVIAVPLLIIGMAGAILGSALGSPEMIITTMGSIAAFILIFAGVTALVGVLMNTGFFEIGILGVALLGIAMIAITVPLLIIATALEKMSNIQIDRTNTVFKDILYVMLDCIKPFFTREGLKYLNPIALAYVASSVALLAAIAGSIGMMADIIHHIATLNIPIEWDKKGKPTKYAAMRSTDFVNAATNAATIIQFFMAVFDDEKRKLPNGVIIGGATSGLKNIKRKTRKKVKRLKKIVGYIGDMADTLQQVASLKIPTEWNEQGKPIKFALMKPVDFLNASLNAAGIITFFAALFKDDPSTLKVLGGTVKITPLDINSLEKISSSTKIKIKRLKTIVGFVGDMASTIQKISTLTVPDQIDPESGEITKWKKLEAGDLDAAAANVAIIMSAIVGAVSSDGLATQLDNMSKKAAKNFERIMGSISGVTGIMDIVQTMASGKIATNSILDNDGNLIPDPNSYVLISEILKNNDIQENIKKMFDIVVGACAPYNTNELKGTLDNAAAQIGNIQLVVAGSTECVNSIITTYNDYLKDIKEEDFTSKYSAASIILTTIVNTLGGAKVDRTKAAIVRDNIKETNNLITKVNSVDIEKLKTASDLMRHISELSQSINGNFKELAKVINEELLEALNKLTGAVDKASNMEMPKPTNVAGNVIAKPSGSAGVKDTKAANQPKSNIKQGDIDSICTAISDIATKINSIIDSSGRALRTVEA